MLCLLSIPCVQFPAVIQADGFTPRTVGTFKAHEHAVDRVDFSPSGELLLTASTLEDTVKVWRVSTRTQIRKWQGPAKIQAVRFGPQGRLAAAIFQKSGRVIIWDVVYGKVRQTIDLKKSYVTAIAFTPAGDSMLCAQTAPVDEPRETQVVLVSLSSGAVLKKFENRHNLVHQIFVDARLGLAVSGGPAWDDTFKNPIDVWEWKTGRLVRSFVDFKLGPGGMVYDAQGRRLVAADRGRAIVVSVDSGRQIRALEIRVETGPSAGPLTPIPMALHSRESYVLASRTPFGVSHGQGIPIYYADTVAGLAMAPGDQLLAVGLETGVVQLIRPPGRRDLEFSGTFDPILKAIRSDLDGCTRPVGVHDPDIVVPAAIGTGKPDRRTSGPALRNPSAQRDSLPWTETHATLPEIAIPF